MARNIWHVCNRTIQSRQAIMIMNVRAISHKGFVVICNIDGTSYLGLLWIAERFDVFPLSDVVYVYIIE